MLYFYISLSVQILYPYPGTVPLWCLCLCLQRLLALASDGNSGDFNDDDSGNDDDSRKGSFGRLRQRMSGNKKPASHSTSSLKQANTNKHDKSIYGGIAMGRYFEYVKELEANFNIEEKECSQLKNH